MIKIKTLISDWRRDYRRFENDPATQLNYHRRMVVFWIVNFLPMNVIVSLDIWATLTGHEKQALFFTAVLLAVNTNYSLYANLDTEMGDAHGAYASLKADEIVNGQTASVTLEPTYATDPNHSFENPGYKPLDKHLVAAVLETPTKDDPPTPAVRQTFDF